MSENPLFIMKFQWWRVLWRLFWPTSIAIPILCLVVIKAPMKHSGFALWFDEIVCLSGLIGGIWMTYDMLLVKDFYLYADRIIQRYKLLKKDKQIFLDKAKYTAMTTPLIGHLAIYEAGQYWKRRIQFDPTLVSSEDMKEFYATLSQLSGRDIEELKTKMFAAKLIAQ